MKAANQTARSSTGCVFRPVVTGRRDGKKTRRRSRFYWAKYRDNSGKVVRHAMKLANGNGVCDKTVAEAELRRILNQLEREAVGLIDPFIASATMPARTVIARFARHLRALRRTPEHVRKTLRRIKWVCESSDIATLGGLSEPTISSALDRLAHRGRAPKTINEYRAAVHGMCKWAMKIARILDRNPVESVAVRDRGGDIRKVRRSLTPGEAGRLLAVSGPRRMWYELALFSGLRVNEMRLLAWGDLVLDGDMPQIELRAATTKSRRGDCVPIKLSLAAKLLALKPPFATAGDHVFKTTPTITTFRRDCVRAGIQYEADDRGRTVDRHALRTTFVSWLSMVGVAPTTAKQLARHTDIALTMRAYTDPRVIDTHGAVEKLPTLDDGSTESTRATGTYDVTPVVPPVVPTTGTERHSASSTGNGAGLGERAQRVSASMVGTVLQDLSRYPKTGGGGNRNTILHLFWLNTG